MIEHIEIGNFRAFSEPVKIRLRPITVLIGKNSAGKSTLMKFLLMLRQSLETSEGDFLTTEGGHLSLGAFRDQQNSNPKFDGRRLNFHISIRTPASPSSWMLELLGVLKDPRGRDHLAKNLIHSFAPNGLKEASEETAYEIKAEVSYFRPESGFHAVDCTPKTKPPYVTKSMSLKGVRFLSFPTNTTRPEGELLALIQNSFLRPLREEILETRHLSPVRQEFQRVVALGNAPQDDVGHQGEFTIQLLHRMLAKEDKAGEFLYRHLQAIANIDRLEFKEQTAQLLSRLQGRNLDTMATCLLNDFGFGVSQCLPVLVQGCVLKKGQLLMVEQPEAQLHPTAQLELGSFFVDLWQQRGVPSLVETHSPNIILRFRQLISNGKLAPQDVSIGFFTTENRHVVVRNLDIRDDGRLEKGLPREFFGADVLELAKFGIPE